MQQLIQKRHRLTLVELVVVIFVVFMLFMMSMPFPNRARESARRVNCAGYLIQIGFALRTYAGDFDGYFPQTRPNSPQHGNFEPLAHYNYIQDGKVWSCPSRERIMTLASDSSYRYIGSGLKDDHAHARAVSLAYDESMNHPKNKWVNVLFIDGHVEGARHGTKPWAHNN